jgi:hypothetical protein
MISLYDYLGKPAGSVLGKEIYIYAKSVKANIGEKIVPTSPFKNGIIRTINPKKKKKIIGTQKNHSELTLFHVSCQIFLTFGFKNVCIIKMIITFY